MMTATPWAILLCKFSDDASEPNPMSFYRNLFTASGTGSHNMVDFFADNSHGAIDVSGSQVFGWYTLPKKRSEYVGSGANQQGRQDLIDWARQAAAARKDDLSSFFGVVVVMNVITDLFGGGGPQAVCDPGSMQPSVLGQEMGHGYGLFHSRIDGSEQDYRDSWDVMSTWNSCYMEPDPTYARIGPGMNAWNMRGRGWLDESRVWSSQSLGFDDTVLLRPLHRRDLPGWLAAELPGGYLAEFRMKEGWDAAIPKPAVLIHRFEDNRSYLMTGAAGTADLAQGDRFEKSFPNLLARINLRVTVDQIDPEARTATLKVVYNVDLGYRPPIKEIEELVAIVSQAVKVGGGGWAYINGRITWIPPRGPVTRIFEQLALFSSPDLAKVGDVMRDAVRREVLRTIAGEVNGLMEETAPFHSPPALVASRSKQK